MCNALSDIQGLQRSWLCASRLAAFFHALDSRDYDLQLEQMEPDAVWHRRGVELAGHDAIRGAMLQRPQSVEIIHVMSQPSFDLGIESIDIQCYVTAYRDGTGALDAPTALYLFAAKFDPQSCRIRYLRGVPRAKKQESGR